MWANIRLKLDGLTKYVKKDKNKTWLLIALFFYFGLRFVFNIVLPTIIFFINITVNISIGLIILIILEIILNVLKFVCLSKCIKEELNKTVLIVVLCISLVVVVCFFFVVYLDAKFTTSCVQNFLIDFGCIFVGMWTSLTGILDFIDICGILINFAFNVAMIIVASVKWKKNIEPQPDSVPITEEDENSERIAYPVTNPTRNVEQLEKKQQDGDQKEGPPPIEYTANILSSNNNIQPVVHCI